MSKVIEIVFYKVNEGVTEEQLIKASDEFEEGFLSLQKGYVGRKLVRDGDTWSDVAFWDSMEDAMNAVKAVEGSTAAESYDACIDPTTCTMQHLTVVKSY